MEEESAKLHLSVDCSVFGFDGSRLQVLLIRRIGEFGGLEFHDMKLPGDLVRGDEELDDTAIEHIRQDYIKARRAWIAEIRKDADKEFAMGDVEEEVYENFIQQLDHEVDYEN